jgi:hypothetical protein
MRPARAMFRPGCHAPYPRACARGRGPQPEFGHMTDPGTHGGQRYARKALVRRIGRRRLAQASVALCVTRSRLPKNGGRRRPSQIEHPVDARRVQRWGRTGVAPPD